MTMQYQIQAAKSEVEKLRSQVGDLLVNAKEYDAPWLKEAGKVVRDASGKFAKSARDVAKSAEGEVVSRYGADAERVVKKAGDIKNDVAAYVSKVAADVKTAAGLLVVDFAQKIEHVQKLSAETKSKLSAILASPAVTERMNAVSSAMGNISAEAKKGYDSAVASIMSAKGNIEKQLELAKAEMSKPLPPAQILERTGNAMKDMGAYVANQMFNSYVRAILSAKNLANIVAKGDTGILKKLYSIPLPDGKSVKDAIAPLLEKMKKWANTAPKALEDKYASTIKAIDDGFNKSFEPTQTGDFDSKATIA